MNTVPVSRSLAAWALLWAGLIIGVSFVATPVKFLAPDLSLPVALQVGKVTFAALQKLNWLALAIGAILLLKNRQRASAYGLTVLALIELLISLWLLPVLDARIDLYQLGQVPAATNHHTVYAALEMVRVALLLIIGFWNLRKST